MSEAVRKTQVRAAERERRRKQRETRTRLKNIPFVLVGLLALVGAGLFAYGAFAQSADIQGKNGPRLQVDRDTLDLGDLHYDKTVRASFKVTNAGDGTLKLEPPKVATAVEGC